MQDPRRQDPRRQDPQAFQRYQEQMRAYYYQQQAAQQQAAQQAAQQAQHMQQQAQHMQQQAPLIMKPRPPQREPLKAAKREALVGQDPPVPRDPFLEGLKGVFALLLLVLVTASVFLIPRAFRVFWLVVVGLGLVMVMGNRVYTDLYNASINEAHEEEKRRKFANSAGLVLYGTFFLFTVVVVVVMAILLWRVVQNVSAKRSTREPEALETQASYLDSYPFNRRL